MGVFTKSWQNGHLAGWMLLVLLALTFLLGGGSRGDIDSLIFLRPIAFLFLGIGLFMLDRETILRFWPGLLLFGGLMVVALIQLAPLPPSIWANMPGHEDFAKAAALTNSADVWRPISMVPSMTKNSALAFTVPLAIAILYCAAAPRFRDKAYWVIAIAALISMLIGILQLSAGPDSPLYFYKITNKGSPVGLLANANHFGAFLAAVLPIIYYLIQRDKRLSIGAELGILAIMWIFFCTNVLAIGSRGGLVLFLISSAFVALAIIVRGPNKSSNQPQKNAMAFRIAVLGSMVLAFTALAVYSANNLAYTDTMTTVSGDMSDEVRWKLVPTVQTMVHDFFPFGAGGGTFPYVFYKYETTELALMSGTSYWNHAHSDLLEFVFEFGVFGLIVLLAAAVGTVIHIWRTRTMRTANQGLSLFVAAIGLAVFLAQSQFDYPLRVPSIACMFAVLLMSAFRIGDPAETVNAKRSRSSINEGRPK